jgi:hypothetical protein
MLHRLLLIVQTTGLQGPFFDLSSPFDDGRVMPEVDIGRRDVVQALVVAVAVSEQIGLSGMDFSSNDATMKTLKLLHW